jgi:hypothetical protein
VQGPDYPRHEIVIGENVVRKLDIAQQREELKEIKRREVAES